VESYEVRLERAVRYHLLQARQLVDSLHAERAEWRMTSTIHRQNQVLDDLTYRMESSIAVRFRHDQEHTAALAAKVLRHDPRQSLASVRQNLFAVRNRIDRSFDHVLREAAARLHETDARLHALSPLAVLDRGYALVQGKDGALIRSLAQVSVGDRVTTRIRDGSFVSRIEETGEGKTERGRQARKKVKS